MKCNRTLFTLMLMVAFTCNVNAEEASSEKTNPSSIESVITVENEEPKSAAASEDLDGQGQTGELAAEDQVEDQQQYQAEPITVTVNENGELVGQAIADVAGDWVPVEANVSLVADGVLLTKVVADLDGSFAIPNVSPGEYNVCGSASSYCGRQAVVVQCNCSQATEVQDNIDLRLSQSEQGCCYSQLDSTPAATFGGDMGFGGLAGGGVGASGGSFATGGVMVGGASGLRRLLTVGGIATAIAVGASDDDDASPSN